MLRTLWIGLALSAVTAAPRAGDGLELLGNTVQLHGRIIDQPCVVAPESLEQEVVMKRIDINELHTSGVGAFESFVIRLTNCKPAIFHMAKVTFSGLQDPQLSGGLAFSAGSAKGAGIRLYDDRQSPLGLGTPSRGYELGSTADNELQFFARVEGHPDALAAKLILPGDYSAVANFIVAYE